MLGGEDVQELDKGKGQLDVYGRVMARERERERERKGAEDITDSRSKSQGLKAAAWH
jgi:hypothetical protein